MRRIATMAAMTAALLTAPATASAAETVYVGATGILTYASDTGQIDAVTLADGTGALAGKHVISETSSPSFAVGIGCTALTAASASCTGASSALLAALDGNDSITLDAQLPGALWAGDGDDTVKGGPLGDYIYGDAGADVLDGRQGNDRIVGGAGSDRIEARDGGVDWIDCGDGDDRATVDDADVVVNCEVEPPALTQQVAPEPTGAVEPVRTSAPALVALAPAVALPAAVGVTAAVADVTPDGTAALELGCAATETSDCSGEVYLDPVGAQPRAKSRSKGGSKRGGAATGRAKKGKAAPRAMLSRRGRFGRSPFVVAAGKRAKVKVKLSAMARKALGLRPARRGKARAARRGRRVRARVTVVQKGRAARRSVVTLRG